MNEPPVLRIFVSSPGDVGREREIAARVIQRLAIEFGGRMKVLPYLWEHEPMRATQDFQGQIPAPSHFEVFACILWSRLGTRLHSQHARPDGTAYTSGTEYEFEDAIAGFHASGKPEFLVYVCQIEPVIPVKPKEVRDERIRQYELLERFIKQWFIDPEEGTLKAAFNGYHDLAQFEEMFEEHLRKLILSRLPKEEAHRAPAALPVAWTKGSPFRGLEAFEFEHEAVFCGRTKATGEVLAQLRDQAANALPLVIILGGSGTGKSSLMRAGVFPLLVRPGVIEGIGLWRWAILRPAESGAGLFHSLARALMAPHALPEIASDGASEDEVARMLRETPQAMGAIIRGGLLQASAKVQTEEKLPEPPKAKLALGIDQLEELFTQTESITPEWRRSFALAIQSLLATQNVWVVATLRSDFLNRLEEWPEWMDMARGKGLYPLQPPNEKEIGQIIRRPAQLAGLVLEDLPESAGRLDDRLIAAAGKDPAVLPMLEFVLDELYKASPDRQTLRHADYETLGGIEGALSKRAEEIHAGLTESGRAAFGAIFRSLVAAPEVPGGNFTRRIASADRIHAMGTGAREVIDAYVQGRLLTSERAPGAPGHTVQLCHEALLNRWNRLRTLLEDDREFLESRARVAAAERHWRASEKNRDLLIPPGKPIEDATRLLTRRSELDGTLIEYIGQSKDRQRSRSGLLLAAAAAIIGLAAVSGVMWWQQQVALGQKQQQALTIESLRQQLAIAQDREDNGAVIELAQRLLEFEPRNSDLYDTLAVHQADEGNLRGVETTLARWEKHGTIPPTQVEYEALRGRAAAANGNLSDAAKHYAAYLQLPGTPREDRPGAIDTLTKIYLENGDAQRAEPLLTEWIGIQDNPTARMRRAEARLGLRRWNDAIADAKTAAQQDPQDSAVLLRFPSFERLEKNLPAIEKSDREVAAAPQNPDARYQRAVTFALAGLDNAALEDLEAAAKLDPSSVRFQIPLAAARQSLGKPADLPEDSLVMASKPSNLGDYLRDYGRFSKELGTLDDALRRSPKDAAALVNRARTYLAIGQPRLALADAEQAALLQPANGDVLVAEVSALVNMRRWLDAIERLRFAQRNAPNAPLILRGFAFVERERGNLLGSARYSQLAADAERQSQPAPPSP
jgi:tetratricopeptide (TPR) repeat protein